MPKISAPVTTLVLVDDHHIVRQGIRALVETEPDLLVIGEAADGNQAMRLVERLRPDILVLDLIMPGMGGLETLPLVKKRCPRTHVIALSMHRDESYVSQALRYGAAAFVLKESNASDLLHAIRQVRAGRSYLSPPLSADEIARYEAKSKEDNLDMFETLTSREQQIFHLTVEGQSSTEIAERLSISPRTVETHRLNLMRKLGLHSLAELVRYAVKRELEIG